MKVKTIFGIDTDGNDIFVIQKANVFKILTREPTDEEWSNLAVEFNLSFAEVELIKYSFNEWKNWYKKARQ